MKFCIGTNKVVLFIKSVVLCLCMLLFLNLIDVDLAEVVAVLLCSVLR